MTGGSAIGGLDFFNGRNKVVWYLLSQHPLNGTHGQSLVQWSVQVNWSSGDNCHRLESASVSVQGVPQWSNSLLHVFNSGHDHEGDWPSIDSFAAGGFVTGSLYIDHDTIGECTLSIVSQHKASSGGFSTAVVSTALPQIPQTVAAPSAATVTRVSDTQQTLNWTNNSTAVAPYANLKVYRSTDGGGYALIATLGVVNTYSDTNTLADHKYTYRITAVGTNTVEVGYADTAAIWTTPDAPTTLTAVKLAGGNIRLTWTNNVGFSEYTTRIEESQNGGAYAELTSVATGVATYDHVAPNPAVTHRYRLRARTTTGATLNSAYSNESDIIVLLSTAGAPTGLAPTTARDAAEAIVFTWVHNPNDGTPQTKYQLQYKVDAGSYVTVGPTVSGVSSYTLPAATVTNGHTITWHVATAAENGTVGAYSADSSFTTSARPTSTISQPSGGTWNASELTALWTYFHPSSVQSGWHAYLYQKISATFADAILIGEQAGSGTTASVTFTGVTLADATTYGVKVIVTSAAGLESSTAGTDLEEFTVTYLPPASATVAAAYDSESGSMVLTVLGDDPVGGVTVAISTVTIQRSIDGGPWVTLIEGLVLAGIPLTAVVLDLSPTVAGLNTYRAIAYSALPSSAVSAEEAVTTTSSWAFLSVVGVQTTVRMRWDGQYDQATDRAGAVHYFAGRTQPVALEGEALSGSLGVSAVMADDSSTEAEVHAFARLPGVKLWRDPFGRRIFARLSGLKTSRRNVRTYNIAFNLTEIDYTEGV